MIFIKRVRCFFKVFYILGLSPFSGESQSTENKFGVGDICKYISFLVTSALCTNCFYIIIYYPVSEGLTPADSYIFLLNITCDMFRSAVLFVQCILHKETFNEINYDFQKIASHFYIHLQHIIPYRSFKRQFVVRILIVFSAYIQYLIRHFIKNPNYFGFSSRLRILQLMMISTFLQIIFYVDLLTFHLNQLNVVIKKELAQKDNSVFDDPMPKRNKLKSIKLLHFRMWCVAQRINMVFGWGMIVLFLYAFLDFIYCFFWVYEEIRNQSSIVYVISKFIDLKNFMAFDLNYVCLFCISGPVLRSLVIGVSVVTLADSCHGLNEQVTRTVSVFLFLLLNRCL